MENVWRIYIRKGKVTMIKYVGHVKGAKVQVAQESMNSHVLITGMSGSGKSVRMTDIEVESIKDGKTVLVLDKDGTHYKLSKSYQNVISVLEDGLDFRLLEPIQAAESMEEKKVQVMYVADILASGQNLGDRQICCLRTAVEYAAEHKDKDATEMYTISRCLEEQKGNSAEGVRSRLWGILNGNLLRPSTKQIESGKINIISLAGINPKTQIQLTEIILSVVWRQLRYRQFSEIDVVCIDEIQSLTLKKNSALFELLTESRKYGISLVLATQSLSVFNKKEIAALGQTAVKLYFHPSEQDIRSIAQQIDPVAYERVAMVLKNLRKGQALTVGDIEKAGHKIGGPIVTMSQLWKEESDCLEEIDLGESR